MLNAGRLASQFRMRHWSTGRARVGRSRPSDGKTTHDDAGEHSGRGPVVDMSILSYISTLTDPIPLPVPLTVSK